MNNIFHIAWVIFAAIFFMVFVGVGLLLVALGIDLLLRWRASAGWSQGSARILSSEVEPSTFDEQTVYRPMIVYAFFAANREYTSRRVSFSGRSYAREEQARQAAARFPAETSVPVYFNPDHPKEAVLERQGIGPVILLILCGLLCWMGPVAGLWFLGIPWWLSLAGLGVLVVAVVWLFGWERRAIGRARKRGIYPRPGEESPEDVRTLLRHGEKGLAIHLFRQLHGGNLKSAHREIEKIEKGLAEDPTA